MKTPFAFLFPGQGSQKVGMLQDIAENFDIVNKTFQEASDALGFDLWDITQNNPHEKLNLTEYTQPALLTASVALWRICQKKQFEKPKLLAGHSLGEYTALVCANSIDFSDAVKLVHQRGRLMQAATQGAMAAIIGLDDQAVIKLCEQSAEGAVLSAANFNSPGQVVIAGEVAAIDRAVANAKLAGAKMAKKLAMSVASHCALMQSAAEELTKYLESVRVRTPEIPVIHNVIVDTISHPDDIKSALVQQLYSPVRWSESIEAITHGGISQFYECGPGKVLAGLNKRINSDVSTILLSDLTQLQELLN